MGAMEKFSIQLDNFLHPEMSGCLRFSRLTDIVLCHKVGQVIPALNRIEKAVRSGLHAAGFISYEAAAAMDPLYQTFPANDLPLLCFGLFKKKQVVRFRSKPRKFYSFTSLRAETNQQEFGRAIEAIHARIKAGDTYQVNYTYRMSGDFFGDVRSFYQHISENQRAEYSALLQFDQYTIASASPELFFRWQNGVLQTKPMKGTAARGVDLAGDEISARYLRHSPKEKAENVMIVDLLRNDMNRISTPGSVHVDKLFTVEKYETVLQMTSTIRSKLSLHCAFAEIFQALFPCGSITGAPKISTMKIIRELEASARGIYTGCIGYFSPGPEAVFNVAIRTALIDRLQHKIKIGIGAGITIGSEAEKEFAECRLKNRFLNTKSPQFHLLETLRCRADGTIFLRQEHLERLRNSARYFRFIFPEKKIRALLVKSAEKTDRGAWKIRLLLHKDGRYEMQIHPLPQPDANRILRLRICSDPVRSRDIFLFHKTTHRQVYDKRLAQFPDCDDIILINEKGEITETTIGNIAVQLGGKKFTPPLQCGLLAGTYRGFLLQAGEIEERILRREDLIAAEKIYRLNSVAGMQKCELVMD